MPSTISAGTTAGTAIAVAGDTTGNLAFQTNGTTTAMTIDTSQNVGIGTTSPNAGAKLTVAGGILATGTFSATSGSTAGIDYSAGELRFFAMGTSGSTKGGYRFVAKGADDSSNIPVIIDPTGNLLFNSGYGSAATAYGCRAWVNFNGTGTPSIRASGNVSSITDNGTGDYTVNFATAMPDANYSFQGLATGVADNVETYMTQLFSTPPTTTSLRIQLIRPNVAIVDSIRVCVAIFR